MRAEGIAHRELTLMFTDIVGYSRLMGRDETLAIQMLGDYRKILLGHIEEHSGVFIEFAGDAVFARFDTAINAVNAAVAIQKHLQLFNQGRDKGLPALQTRIGLHKGAVILRDDNAVLGDDVNIAARLEPLAVADGICISKPVYDEIRTQLREPIKPLGVQSLKNIEQKIRAYLIKPTGLGWRDHLHYFWLGFSKKINAYRYPLIALFFVIVAAGFYFIPRWLVPGYAANYVEIANFQNLMKSGGESDYFSSGITEAVRSQLADMRDVYIVEADKGIHAPIRLEGSVQRIGDNVRIAYRILRRKGNIQIAGGKLDGPYQDIFVLQDRLVGEIARYLASEFKLQNFRPAPLKLTNDITAYDYYLQGMDYLNKPLSEQNFDEAIQRFNQALVHDNQFALANSGLCEAYRLKYELTKAGALIESAEKYCIEAIKQGGNSAKTYEAFGAVYRNTGRYEEAVKYLKEAINKNPDDLSAIVELACTYDFMKRDADADNLYRGAIKSFPKNWQAYQEYGYFLSRKGRYNEAINAYKKVLQLTPENVTAYNNMGAAYLYTGDFGKAANALEEATKIEPRGNAYLNSGSMYYFAGNFRRAVKMYKQALQLQPNRPEYLVNIADAYMYIGGGQGQADEYFKRAQIEIDKEISANPGNVSNYQFRALAYAHFGNIDEAKKSIDFAYKLDADNVVSYYVSLRVAVMENNDGEIFKYVKKLLSFGYSDRLILADPYFLVIKENQSKYLY